MLLRNLKELETLKIFLLIDSFLEQFSFTGKLSRSDLLLILHKELGIFRFILTTGKNLNRLEIDSSSRPIREVKTQRKYCLKDWRDNIGKTWRHDGLEQSPTRGNCYED